MAAMGGSDSTDNTSAAAVRTDDITGDVGARGTPDMADEGAVATGTRGAAGGNVTSAHVPAVVVETKKKRARRSHTGQDARKCLRRAESLPAGRSRAPGLPSADGGDGDNLM